MGKIGKEVVEVHSLKCVDSLCRTPAEQLGHLPEEAFFPFGLFPMEVFDEEGHQVVYGSSDQGCDLFLVSLFEGGGGVEALPAQVGAGEDARLILCRALKAIDAFSLVVDGAGFGLEGS